MEHTELCTSLTEAWQKLGSDDGFSMEPPPELRPVAEHLRHAWRWAHAICIQAEQKAQREDQAAGRHRALELVGPQKALVKSLVTEPPPGRHRKRRVWQWAVPMRDGSVARGIEATWREAMDAVARRLRGETYADRWARRSGHPVGSGSVARHAAGAEAPAEAVSLSPPSRPRHADGAPVAVELPEALAYRRAARALAGSTTGRDRPVDHNRSVAGSALASLDQERFWQDLGRAA